MKLENIFQNGMVFQREKPIRIFGTGEGTAKAELCGSSAISERTADGWIITLPSMPAGGPYTVKLELNGTAAELKDVMIGEVFIASGQSNMEMPLFRTQCGFSDAKYCDDDGIRFYTVPKRFKDGVPCMNRHFESLPNTDGPWQKCTEESALHFTAIGFYFAKHIRETLNIPVGIISCNWGGRAIRTFIPYEKFLTEPILAADLERYKNACASLPEEEYEEKFNTYIKELEEQCILHSDTFENAKLYGHGYAMAHDAFGKVATPAPYGKYAADRPGGMWQTMIRHICPFSTRGVLWYQGESDSPSRIYFEKYSIMLESWREKFLDPELPFIAVELAPYRRPGRFNPQPDNDGFSFIREQQQRAAKELKNSYLATVIDCGDEFDIHPQNKKTPAERMWRLAYKYIYGGSVEADAPEYESHTFLEDGAAIIKVKNAKRLFASGIREFWIAGEDGVFYPANAVLAGDTAIRARAPKVKEPKYIRYAFFPFPQVGYLYNESGLPLMPFRTDMLTNATHICEL